ncbi:MAG: type II toxin-antitoxin system YafQ family toxin [Candidatus Paceibacterota bacterium]|jgi:mRNA interferase YafQ
MLKAIYTKKYEKSLRKYKELQKFSVSKLEDVLIKLQNQIPLDKKFQDHPLNGKLSHQRECHIYPDILLVYEVVKGELILVLVNLGSHSELFK